MVHTKTNHDPSAPCERDAQWYDALVSQQMEGLSQGYWRSYYYFLWAIIADRVRRSRMLEVLEIGCGPGRLAAFLLDQGVNKYVGLDFSPKAIALARQLVPAGQFVVDDARTTTLPSKIEHDVLICTEVLEHVDDDLAIISRFRPGKRCLCSVPSFPHESHVRSFQDVRAVAERYGRFFHSFDAMTLRSPNCDDHRFFLFDGVRSEVGAG
jgi:SAM-dependent methyltransferase